MKRRRARYAAEQSLSEPLQASEPNNAGTSVKSVYKQSWLTNAAANTHAPSAPAKLESETDPVCKIKSKLSSDITPKDAVQAPPNAFEETMISETTP